MQDFSLLTDREERSAYLIELADQFQPVPARIAAPPYSDDHRVPFCESEAYVWAEDRPDGTLKFHFAVENPQGLSAMAMAAILDQTLSGQPLDQVAQVPDDIVLAIFGRNISMGKGQGLMGIVAMVREAARRRQRERKADPDSPCASGRMDMPDSTGLSFFVRGFFRALTRALDSCPWWWSRPDRSEAGPAPGDAHARRPLITPNGVFFPPDLRPGADAPEIDLGTWRLAVGGLVETPLFLSLTQLWTLPSALDTCTLMCLGNPPGGDQVGNATWRGVRLADLLARTGVRPEATHLCFEAADGYTLGLPLGRGGPGPESCCLRDERRAAAPRLTATRCARVFPGRYGLKSTKWLKAITLVDYAPVGTWEAPRTAGATSGVVKTWSRIVPPSRTARFGVGEPGRPARGGLCRRRGASRAVEVSLDGARWLRTRCARWSAVPPGRSGTPAGIQTGPATSQLRCAPRMRPVSCRAGCPAPTPGPIRTGLTRFTPSWRGSPAESGALAFVARGARRYNCPGTLDRERGCG